MDSPTQIDDYLELSTIVDLIEHWKQRGTDPAIVAVGSAGAMVVHSYAALSSEVLRLAGGLRRARLRDGALILLWAPNSPEWVIAYFSIVAAGMIVIPLDEQMSPEQLPGVVRNSMPDCVFTTAGHLETIRRAGFPADVRCFLLDADETAPGSWRQAAVAGGPISLPPADPGQVRVLLYTSGTTGTPKGVPLTHANLMSNVRALVAADIINKTDRVLLPLPLHHAYPATVGMLSVLACGATVVLPSGVSGPELTTAANRAGATILIGVPRLYEVLADSIETGVRSSGVVARSLYPLLLATAMLLHRILHVRVGGILFRRIHRRIGGRLRLLVSGGARLEPELASKLEGLGWLVLTGYGLTETSPVVSFNTLRHRRLDSQGMPVSGVDIQVDKTIDEPYGEILIKGPNVFSGYWMDEAATREAFTEAGWFRTNDLGFLDPEGYLHVMGRKTEVIVLSDGKKISPEGLERLYEASPFIREAALLGHNGTLAAIIVPDEEALRGRGAISAKSLLRDELERELQSLPSYQRVAEFRLARQSLPRTRLGKLKRHLLPEIFASASAASAAPSAALPEEGGGSMESETVRAAWSWLQQRYAVPGITLDSSPQLDLGIDSLGWVSLTTELEQKFGIAPSAQDLSRVLTVRDLLQAIDSASQHSHEVPGKVDTDLAEAERYLDEPSLPLKVFGWLLLRFNKLLMRILFRLRIHGLDRLPARGPFVIAPNHASYLDPLAVAAALPGCLLKRTCWAGWAGKMHKGPVSRAVSRATAVFPVDPDRDIGGGIRLGATVLERGRPLVWFPEGRRSPGGGVQTFRRGIGVLLEQSRVQAVPVRITGSFKAWPLTRKWPRPHPITIVFGSPESVESLLEIGVGEDQASRISDGLERRVRDLEAR